MIRKNKRIRLFLWINPILLFISIFLAHKYGPLPFIEGFYSSFERIDTLISGEQEEGPKHPDYLWIDTSPWREDHMIRGAIVNMVDRDKLVEAMSFIDSLGEHKLIVSTLSFEYPTKNDDSIAKVLGGIDHLILRRPDKGGIPRAFKGMKHGSLLSRKFMTDHKLMGIDLFQNQRNQEPIKSIPLLIREAVQEESFKTNYSFFIWYNGKVMLRDFTPLKRIEEQDIIRMEPDHMYFILSSKEGRKANLKDRIVIFGNLTDAIEPILYDLSNEETSLPDPDKLVPISIYTLNTYESLKQGDNQLSIWLLMFIYFLLLLSSFMVIPIEKALYVDGWKEMRIFKLFERLKVSTLIVDMIFGSTKIILAFVLLSYSLFLFFDVILDLSFAALLLFVERLIIKKII